MEPQSIPKKLFFNKLSLFFGPNLGLALSWAFSRTLNKKLSRAQYLANKVGLNIEPFDSFNSRAKNWAKMPKFWPENRLNFKSFGSNYGQAKIFDSKLSRAKCFFLARPNIEPRYLKYRLHEFIVKFNIKFIKGSST